MTDTEAKNKRDYAIVIGIKYPWLRPLQGTLKDAAAFIAWLKSPTGGSLPDVNIAPILSPPQNEAPVGDAWRPTPIKDQIDIALERFGIGQHVGRKTRIGRRLYFYFSGHGLGPRSGEVGMLMADADINNLNNSISLQKYLELFRNTDLFEEVVFILDCCRDAAPLKRGVDPPGPKATPPIASRPPDVGHLLVLAAPYGRRAIERTANATGERRGLLTTAVLEALTDPRQVDEQGRFTSETLRRYVPWRVSRLAREMRDKKLDQEPEIVAPSPEKSIVFAKVPQSALDRVAVRIVAPSGLSGDLVVLNNRMAEVDRRPAAEVTADKPAWKVKLLRNEWYMVSHTDDAIDATPEPIRWRAVQEKGNVFHFPTAG